MYNIRISTKNAIAIGNDIMFLNGILFLGNGS